SISRQKLSALYPLKLNLIQIASVHFMGCKISLFKIKVTFVLNDQFNRKILLETHFVTSQNLQLMCIIRENLSCKMPFGHLQSKPTLFVSPPWSSLISNFYFL